MQINGLYVCVPCGYKKRYSVGEVFGPCTGCMRVSKPISNTELKEAEERGEEIDEFAEEAVAPDLETWELLKEE